MVFESIEIRKEKKRPARGRPLKCPPLKSFIQSAGPDDPEHAKLRRSPSADAVGLTILVKGVEVPLVAVDLLSADDGPGHSTQSRSDPAILQPFARRAIRRAFHKLQQAAHPIRLAPLPRYRLARYACEILSLRAIWNSVELQTHLSWWRATAAGCRLHAQQLQRRQATALVALAVASLVRQNLVRAAQSARAGHERRALAAWFTTLARSRSLVQAVVAVRERRRRRAIAAGLAAVGAEAASALVAVRSAGARHVLRALRGHAVRRHEWRGALARSAALRARRAAQAALRAWAALLPVALLWRCAERCAAEARRGAARTALARLCAHAAAAASARRACEPLLRALHALSAARRAALATWRLVALAGAARRSAARRARRRMLLTLSVAAATRRAFVAVMAVGRAAVQRRAVAAGLAAVAEAAERSRTTVRGARSKRALAQWRENHARHAWFAFVEAEAAAVGRRRRLHALRAHALALWREQHARHAWFACVEAEAAAMGRRRRLRTLCALRVHAARKRAGRAALRRGAECRVWWSELRALEAWAALLPVALLWRCAGRCAAEARRGAARTALARLCAHAAAVASARRAERCAAQGRRQAAHHALCRLEAHAQACATAAALRAAVAADRARSAVGAWRGASAATARLVACAAEVRRSRRRRATRHWALAARAAAAAAMRASEADAVAMLGALARLRRVWRRLGGGSGGAGAAATNAWRRRLRAALAQWRALAAARPSPPCVSRRARARALALWRQHHACHAWFALVEAAAVGVGRRRQLRALRDACLSAATRRRWLVEQWDARCARGAPLRARLVCRRAMARWAAHHERAWMAAAAATRGALQALAASLLLWRSWAARFSLARLRWRRLGDAVGGRWRQALHERQETLGRLSAATRSWRSDADERWRRSYNCFAVEAVAVAKHDYVPLTFSSKPTGTPTAPTRTVKHPAAEPGPGGGPPTWLLTAESVLEATTPPASPAPDGDRRRLASPRLFPTSPAERASHDGKENTPGEEARGARGARELRL